MAVCAGSVSGAVVRAAVNRVPRAASASIAGVSPRPTRSARSVSMVISSTFGLAAGAAGGALHALNDKRTAIAAARFTRRLSHRGSDREVARQARLSASK
jgi:hypothetical protein